jgi:hypothetical protein
MSYAILRLSKLKNLGMATSATQHNYRLQDTPNADPGLAPLNEELLNHEQRNYWRLANERIAELGLPRLRSDAVRAVELVLTASPEAFPREADGHAKDVRGKDWVLDNFNFVRQRFGEKNVVSFTLHQDEVTPHIHCVVVPVTPDGRLSSRDVFSPKSLRQLQTDYAKAMEPHGLERGIKYSTAIHEDVRRHYGAQQTSKEALAEVAKPLPTAPYQLSSVASWDTPANHQAREQLCLNTYIFKLTSTANQQIAQLAAVASANALEHERARVLEKQLAHSQELLVKVRAELAGKTDQLQQQQARTTEATQLHKRAVIRHLQGQPVPEKYVGLAQKLRGQHQTTIEGVLAKRLALPIYESADLGPSLEQAGYALKVVSPQELCIVSKRDGTRFSDAELRPNGRGLAEQFQVAVQRTRAQQQYASEPKRDNGIEM